MGKLMTTTFFNFLLGFVMILAMSLGIIYATGQMDNSITKAKSSASAFVAGVLR